MNTPPGGLSHFSLRRRGERNAGGGTGSGELVGEEQGRSSPAMSDTENSETATDVASPRNPTSEEVRARTVGFLWLRTLDGVKESRHGASAARFPCAELG